MKKKVISWILVIALTLSFSIFASADEIITSDESDAILSDAIEEDVTTVADVSAIKNDISSDLAGDDIVFTMDENGNAVLSDERLEISEPIVYEGNDANIGNVNYSSGKKAPKMETDKSKKLTAPVKARGPVGNPAAGTYTGTIPNAGGAAWILVDVNPGEALYALLECPFNPQLDYDLYIYDYYSGQIEDVSDTWTHFNTVRGVYKTVDEGCFAVNTSAQTKTYVVQVQAVVGYSAVNIFRLHVDVTDSWDSTEPNANVFSTIQVPYGNVSFTNSIESFADQNWFVFVATPVQYGELEYKCYQVSAGSANADLYEYVNVSSKLQLEYCTESISRSC